MVSFEWNLQNFRPAMAIPTGLAPTPLWAVNGCQSEVLVIRNFKFNCQGFIVGYNIKSPFLYSLFKTRPLFTIVWPVERSFLIVS